MNDGLALSSRLTLYRSHNLHLFRYKQPPAGAEVLAICFQYLLETPDLKHTGFAQEFFAKRAMDAIFVNCATNEWYQYDDLPEALECLHQSAVSRQRVVTYGSSMGGYAALRFAGAIGAHASIAVAPQYSPRSSVVPTEYRYDALLKETTFLYEKHYRASSAVHNYVIYDPLSVVDREHVTCYGKEIAMERIAICQGGHTPTVLLSACGLLPGALEVLLDGSFDSLRLRHILRSWRRDHVERWGTITRQIADCDRKQTAQYKAALRTNSPS